MRSLLHFTKNTKAPALRFFHAPLTWPCPWRAAPSLAVAPYPAPHLFTRLARLTRPTRLTHVTHHDPPRTSPPPRT